MTKTDDELIDEIEDIVEWFTCARVVRNPNCTTFHGVVRYPMITWVEMLNLRDYFAALLDNISDIDFEVGDSSYKGKYVRIAIYHD